MKDSSAVCRQTDRQLLHVTSPILPSFHMSFCACKPPLCGTSPIYCRDPNHPVFLLLFAISPEFSFNFQGNPNQRVFSFTCVTDKCHDFHHSTIIDAVLYAVLILVVLFCFIRRLIVHGIPHLNHPIFFFLSAISLVFFFLYHSEHSEQAFLTSVSHQCHHFHHCYFSLIIMMLFCFIRRRIVHGFPHQSAEPLRQRCCGDSVGGAEQTGEAGEKGDEEDGQTVSHCGSFLGFCHSSILGLALVIHPGIWLDCRQVRMCAMCFVGPKA